MLELRPACEHCNKALPPESTAAQTCTSEGRFGAPCVKSVLFNVCPNCGGGFERRPVRPAQDWKGGNFLGANPASVTIVHRPVDPARHATLVNAAGDIAPE